MTDPDDGITVYTTETARDTYDLIRSFGGSPQRVQVFDVIRQAEAADPEGLRQREIARRIPDSVESTIHDAVVALEDNLLLERTNNRLTLSPVGELIEEEFQALVDVARAIDNMEPFVSQISNYGEADLRELIEHWTDAEVIKTDLITGFPPNHPYPRLVDSVDRVLELVPFLTGESTEFQRRFEEGELGGEFILVPDVLAQLRENYPELFRIMVTAEHVRIYEYEAETSSFPEFTMSIFPDRSTVAFIERREGSFVSFTENEEVRRWAEDVYDEYRGRATEISEV